MKHLFSVALFIAIVCNAVGANAQVPRVVQKAGQTLKKVSPATGRLSRYSGTMGSVMGVDYYLARMALQTQTPPLSGAATSAATSRSWLTQTVRDFKAWNLRRQRRVRDAQNDAMQEQLARMAALEATLPQLNPARILEVESFEALYSVILPEGPFPLLERPGVLYRGLALDPQGNAVRNILTNGLRVEDLGVHASTKLLAMSGGMRGTVSTVTQHPATNLTSFPEDAIFWATQRVAAGKELFVIVCVRGDYGSGKVVLYTADIPAEHIEALLVPLRVNGNINWYKVELAENGLLRAIAFENPDAPIGPVPLPPAD